MAKAKEIPLNRVLKAIETLYAVAAYPRVAADPYRQQILRDAAGILKEQIEDKL